MKSWEDPHLNEVLTLYHRIEALEAKNGQHASLVERLEKEAAELDEWASGNESDTRIAALLREAAAAIRASLPEDER